jgi:hypothetical protein
MPTAPHYCSPVTQHLFLPEPSLLPLLALLFIFLSRELLILPVNYSKVATRSVFDGFCFYVYACYNHPWTTDTKIKKRRIIEVCVDLRFNGFRF